MILLALLLGVATHAPVPVTGPQPEVQHTQRQGVERYTLDQILDAIRVTESGGHRDGGRHATGDGGRAIGPYQIHRSHWLDARVPGQFQDCRDPGHARRVVVAYWRRWCPSALEVRDAEVLARFHNGGPRGAEKACTLAYWNKVKSALTRTRTAPAAALLQLRPSRLSPTN